MTDGREPSFLGSPDLDRTVGLVLELAAQLHTERHRRIVLEATLRERGLLGDDEMARAAADPQVIAAVAEALDRAQRRLFDVITELDDVAGPLRPADESTAERVHEERTG